MNKDKVQIENWTDFFAATITDTLLIGIPLYLFFGFLSDNWFKTLAVFPLSFLLFTFLVFSLNESDELRRNVE